MILPKLFKTKNSKSLFWEIETRQSQYIVKHGYVGGAVQVTSTDVPQGKNIGQANETTAVEQCELEAKSLWTKQRDRKGYSETQGAIATVPRPMLAHSYDDYPNKVSFPLLVQPKLDGIRCLAYLKDGKVILLSRQMKEFNHLNHIRQVLLETFFKVNRSIILDGELYAHGMEFQTIISAVKRDEVSKDTSKIKYNIYDNIHAEYGCYTRLKYLENLYVQFRQEHRDILKFVETKMVNNVADIDKWHEHYTKQGYEGIMLRNTHGMYVQDKRSFDLLKYKKFKDQEFLIIGAEENKGKCKGQCSLICETKEGTQFKVKPEGSDSERRKYWDDWVDGKLKGKYITVRFFSWSDSVPPVPRFPVGVAIRDYD